MASTRSGWREPMVWLVAGLPLAAVIGSIALVIVAVRSGNDDAIYDQVQRTGQAQVADLDADTRAGELKLNAVVQIDKGTLRVFPAGGAFARNEPLHLTLIHPQHQASDRSVDLQPDPTGWHAELTLDGGNDWIVHVTDQAVTWRLRGRLLKGQRAAHLGPSLQIQ